MQKLLQQKKKKNNNNTLIQRENITSHQQPKMENVNIINNNRTLIIGFSNCGEMYLMKYIILWEQEPIFIITKSLNQNPNIKAQTSNGIQSLTSYQNSTVVFDDILLSKQEAKIDLFSQEDLTIFLVFTIYLKAVFISQKIQFVIILL